MQRVETFPVLYKDREEDRMKVRENGSARGMRERKKGRTKKEMNLDVLIQDGKTEWREGWGKEGEEGAVGSGVRSRFLEPFNDIPEENEWRRRAPDGRNGVGFSWRRMANRVAQSWKMRLCVLESHSPACISPCARRILVSSSISLCSSVLRKYVSIHIYARSCYIVRPNNTRVRRSISIWLPEMRLTGPCGFVRITRKNMARVRVRMELYSPLSGWYQTRFRRWSTISPAKWENGGQDWRMKDFIFRAENYLRIFIS